MDNSKVTTPKPFCFVLMPFSSEFDDIYQIGIKEACDKAGAYCERVDEQIYGEKILDRVYNQISKADIVIADMTGRNPNVFYEVGYAHALGKLTILLTQDSEDIPFDLKPFPHIVYKKKIAVLRDKLEERVKYFVDNPPDKTSDSKIGLDLFLGKYNLALGKAVCNYSTSGVFDLEITAHNSTFEMLSAGSFRVGIITEVSQFLSKESRVETIKLPDEMNLYMLDGFPDLFPNGYAVRSVRLIVKNDSKKKLFVRLFTTKESRDFPVRLNYIQ